MKDKLIITTPMYDEEAASQRLYQTIQHYKLPWLISYGAFLEYGERKHDQSYLDKFENTTILFHKPVQEQSAKEKLCHTVGKLGYDWELGIGSDEWFSGSIEVMLSNAKRLIQNPDEPHIFLIKHLEHNPNVEQQGYYMRLLYKPHLLTVRGNHWTFFYKNKILKPIDEPVHGVVIHQDDRIRGKKRDACMNEYQKKRIVKEWALSNYMIIQNFAENELTDIKLSELFPDKEIKKIRNDMYFVKNGSRPNILTPYWNFYPVSDGLYIEQKDRNEIDKTIYNACINEGVRLAKARNLT